MLQGSCSSSSRLPKFCLLPPSQQNINSVILDLRKHWENTEGNCFSISIAHWKFMSDQGHGPAASGSLLSPLLLSPSPFLSLLLGSARRRLGKTISSRQNKVCASPYCPCSSPCAIEGTGPTAHPAWGSLQSLWGSGIPLSLSWAGPRQPTGILCNNMPRGRRERGSGGKNYQPRGFWKGKGPEMESDCKLEPRARLKRHRQCWLLSTGRSGVSRVPQRKGNPATNHLIEWLPSQNIQARHLPAAVMAAIPSCPPSPVLLLSVVSAHPHLWGRPRNRNSHCELPPHTGKARGVGGTICGEEMCVNHLPANLETLEIVILETVESGVRQGMLFFTT